MKPHRVEIVRNVSPRALVKQPEAQARAESTWPMVIMFGLAAFLVVVAVVAGGTVWSPVCFWSALVLGQTSVGGMIGSMRMGVMQGAVLGLLLGPLGWVIGIVVWAVRPAGKKV